MKILLTGGAGYIGSHVLISILENKHDVVVIDDLSTGNKSLIPENIRLINANINDSEKISTLLLEENFDLLLHFAGFIKVEESVQNPDKYFKNNCWIVRNHAACNGVIPSWLYRKFSISPRHRRLYHSVRHHHRRKPTQAYFWD